MRLRHALLFALLPMLGWWLTGLLDLDEGFYGAVAAEMNRRGEWITPYYNDAPWFEKPILTYWLLKPSLAVFAPDFGARLPSVICHLLTCALLGWWASRRLSPGSGPLAILIYGTMLLPVALGRMLMTDPPLVVCLTAAILAYLESRERPQALILTGIALGFGVLAKGPVALILFAPVAVWLAVRDREWRRMLGSLMIAFVVTAAVVALWLGGSVSQLFGHVTLLALVITLALRSWLKLAFWVPLIGIVLMLAIPLLLWYLPAYRANGDLFVQKFLIEQNIGRFTGGDEAHTPSNPLAYLGYLPVALLGAGPWLVTGWLNRKRDPAPRDLTREALLVWALATLLFFTVSGAKLPHYILPMFPPMALLIADRLARLDAPRYLRMGRGWAVGMAVFANIAFFAWYALSGQAEAHRIAKRALTPGANLAAFQLSRRQAALGTGQLKIQETSLPSLGLYWNQTWTDTDDWARIDALPNPVRAFTRVTRPVPPAPWRVIVKGEHYILYGRD